MSELALKLIKEAKEKRLTSLDLRWCGLTKLPNELFQLTWLEELLLSDDDFPYNYDDKYVRIVSDSENDREYISNDLKFLHFKIGNLKKLRKLAINGHPDSKGWALKDISPLRQLTNLEELNISCTQVINLYPIKNLTKLKSLWIHDTKIHDLTPLQNLINLEDLLIFFTPIIDLNPLRNLTNLRNIYAREAEISDLYPLENLIKIEYLDLNHTKVYDLTPLKNLTKLKTLQLTATYIDDLSPLGNLMNLEILVLSETEVSDLFPLENLIKIKKLELESTEITDLSPLHNLTELRSLTFTHTQVSDLSPLSKLINLKKLYCSDNQIKSIAPLKNLTNLTTLNIDHNQVSDLSPLKKLLEKGISVEGYIDGISAHDCPLTNPPQFIFEQGNDAILRHWQDLETKKSLINNQTKLIFVGNSRAGKTSLWQFLKDKIYDKNASSTHGIKTEIWDEESLNIPDNQQLAAHIWDFGGQEYYHATHRLFLSDNAIYVLVWEEESNFKGSKLERFKLDEGINGEIEEVELDHFSADYWLNNIRHYSRNSPILIVQNKVDEAYQKANYTEGVQNPYDCFHLSVQNAFYFQEGDTQFEEFNLDFQSFKLKLLKALRKNATALTILKYYAQVREKLEKLRDEKEYISLEELNAIALIYDETPDMQNLLAYLKSFTNTVLYFRDNSLLKDRLYLNPKDISQAIYKILNKEVRKNDGKFDLTHIQNRLNCDAIEAERYVALMIEFDLIFEKNKTIKNEIQRQFTTPQYLPKKEDLSDSILLFINAEIFENAFKIQFKNFVPRSLMLRFIANNGAKANQETYWHNGIVYKSPLTQSMIKVEYDNDLTFTISVQNKTAQIIDMQDIIKQFERLEPDTRSIKISNNGQNYVDLNNLYKCLRDNRTDKIQTNEGVIISIKDYEWLIEKQKNKDLITIENIKKQIQDLIGKAKIKEALDKLSDYAFNTKNAQLTQYTTVLKGNLTRINQDTSVLISYEDAHIEINRLGNGILELLNSF